MIFLENFNSYFSEKITLFEFSEGDIFDLLLENKELSECPCNLTKGWEQKIKFNDHAHLNIGLRSYKKCCHFFDDKHFNNRVKKELNTQNNIYTYTSPNNRFLQLQIFPSFHWYERFYRKSDERYKNDPDVVNPNMDEAIDILVNNIDRIGEKILKFQKNSFYMELTKENSVDDEGNVLPYSTIISVEKINYDFYKLTLITHVKGKRKYSRKYETTKMYVEKLIFEGYTAYEILQMI